MPSLERRLAKLEAADVSRRSDGRLVLVAARGVLTAAQHAEVDAAQRDGRGILVIEILAAGTDRAKAMQ